MVLCRTNKIILTLNVLLYSQISFNGQLPFQNVLIDWENYKLELRMIYSDSYLFVKSKITKY